MRYNLQIFDAVGLVAMIGFKTEAEGRAAADKAVLQGFRVELRDLNTDQIIYTGANP
jgi:hypothetical protein